MYKIRLPLGLRLQTPLGELTALLQPPFLYFELL